MSTLNIFVSGTIDDQRAERNTVGAAVESLRLDATRAETQYSSERSSREECLRMVRECCDVYLGVFTQTRYGWTIPSDGISVTEMEFNEAQRLNKPTLIFAQKLPKDWTPKDDKEKEQREKQIAFLNRVLDFDGGKFRAAEFETLTQLENQVAGSLMQLLVERFKMTVTRPPFLAPRNLDVFVGRVTQIETLTRALARNAGEDTSPLLVYGFYGVGGLGKTALALQIAHALRGQFDGGVLWADLPTARPDQMLADWAREYGADVSKIEETNARADAVRKILQGRHVLAFLDGAVDEADDEKIAPLLRALADCAVIVTSRVTQLNSLANARRVNLDKMSEDEAVELFERIVGAGLSRPEGGMTPPLPRDKIIAIARVVDFLPLALDLAATQWREHSSWTADDVLAMLRDERARLDTLNWGDGKTRGIRASIEASYKRLTSDEQKFFAALGAFAGDDFDATAAAFVTEDVHAPERLERFLRLSLVQEGRRALRYRLHPLLRDFARSEGRIANSELRMARHYCGMARENGSKLEGREIEDALAILDLELSNIYAGQACTVDKETGGQGDKERWELCRDYIISLAPYFGLRSQWNDWIAWSEAGIAASQKLGDARSKGAITGNLGLVYAKKGAWDQAIEFYQKSLATKEKVGDAHGMAVTYMNIGNVQMQKGAWDQAIEFYQKDLAISEKLGDLHGMAQTYTNLGNVYLQKGAWDQAIEFYQNALGTMEKVGDLHGMAQTYNNLGVVYKNKGQWDQAIEFYQNALATMEKVGDLHGMAQTWGNLGNVYKNKGEWDRAIEFYQKDLAISEKLGDLHGMAVTYMNIGNVQMQKGEWDAAIASHSHSLEIRERLGDVHGMAQTWGNLGIVYLQKGEWDRAIEFYQKDLAISEKLGDLHGMAQTWGNLGAVYMQKGAWDQAIEFYQQAINMMAKVGDVHGVAQTYGNLGSVYLQKGEWDKASEFYQQALDTMEKIGDTHGMAQTFGNLGVVYKKQGKIDDAIAYCKKSLEITERLGDVVTSSNTYWNLGTLYEQQDKIAQAIEWMGKSVAIRKKIGHPDTAKDTEYVEELRKKLK